MGMSAQGVADMMPYSCAVCHRPFECQGDTGGTSDSTPEEREERLLWESLLRNRRGHFAGTQLRTRDDVGVARFTPSQARYLAVACSERYPAGVVTLHLGERQCCRFTPTGLTELLHLGCAVDLLRSRLSVGIVVHTGGAASVLQLGRRPPPLLRELRRWRA